MRSELSARFSSPEVHVPMALAKLPLPLWLICEGGLLGGCGAPSGDDAAPSEEALTEYCEHEPQTSTPQWRQWWRRLVKLKRDQHTMQKLELLSGTQWSRDFTRCRVASCACSVRRGAAL